MKVRWTEAAARRLQEIHAFVARDDAAAADRLATALLDLADTLASLPRRGRPVPELPGSDLRELLHGNYRLAYRIHGRAVEVLTVFEGHRLLRAEEVG